MKNLFCNISDLKNEATVETYFIDRLLEHLGYSDSDISRKESISEYSVGKGNQKSLYKPDYVIKSNGIPTVVIDAKSPKENIRDWEHQCSSYCLEINKEFDYNPVKYYLLSNALQTAIYKWDQKEPLLIVNFESLKDKSEDLKKIETIISKKSIGEISIQLKEDLENSYFPFKKINLDELTQIFQKIHQEIWQSEKKGPSASFQELIKIFFVKIRKDKEINQTKGKDPKPLYKDVVFSCNWIATQSETKNPINDILFKNLLTELEKDIISGKKKRFFEKNDEINISSETMKKVVREIENVNLFGMEEDIHGRMFEAFLDATIRGKDIGQFFTPRDVVELMVELGSPKVQIHHVDKVLDACCGSGGFLITALSNMLNKLNNLRGINQKELEIISNIIKLRSVYGIDAGSDPAMFKIARMNMYLHGDGGSNIYYADSLDKGIGRIGPENIEVDSQIEELRKLILENGLKFDLILSNPPFSLQYTRENKEQSTILNQYKLSRDDDGGKLVSKLMSSVMFIERYKDLITDQGKIIAVIDDSVLSGSSYSYVRNYIRKYFIIEAIISLPGDAFRRASARVKTSIIILKKNSNIGERQKDIFMDSSISLGLELQTAKRIGIKYKELKTIKQKERDRILDSYKDYLEGKKVKQSVSFENCLDRLDVKYCINDRGRKAPIWKKSGYSIITLGKVLTEAKSRSIKVEEDTNYPLLIVNYDGEINDGEVLDGSESSYSKLYKVKTWDLLISNMGFGRGAISIVPPYHNGKFVSNEYTILNAPSKYHAIFYWNLLRTKEIMGDIFSSTTGMNRGRIKWDIISNVLVPEFKENKEIKSLTEEMESFWKEYEKFNKSKNIHTEKISKNLGLNDEDSLLRWLSFKPPE